MSDSNCIGLEAFNRFERLLGMAEDLAELMNSSKGTAEPQLTSRVRSSAYTPRGMTPGLLMTPRGTSAANLAQAENIKLKMQAAAQQAEQACRSTQHLNQQAARTAGASRTQSPLPPLHPGLRSNTSPQEHHHQHRLRATDYPCSPICITEPPGEGHSLHPGYVKHQSSPARGAQTHRPSERPDKAAVPAPCSTSDSGMVNEPAPAAVPGMKKLPVPALSIATACLGVLKDTRTNAGSKGLSPVLTAGSGFSFASADSPSSIAGVHVAASTPTSTHVAAPTPQLKPLGLSMQFL